ncbi:MAG: chromate resistance protein ChrB domain-containing protein [Thermodesulfobacteriota bacterium]
MEWLLLIHQIPAKPAYFRVRVLRRLQQLGAVAVKQSVYALPAREQAREDFTWLVKEISDEGGEAVLVEARFLEGMDDRQLVALFSAARRREYEGILAEVGELKRKWRQADGAGIDAAAERRAVMTRLRKAFGGIAAIDFFPGAEQAHAEAALAELENLLRRQQDHRDAGRAGAAAPAIVGRTWVTRRGVYVDRMACAWLIKRFIDPGATLKFVDDSRYRPVRDEVRYDMGEAEYSHEGSRCSFEVLVDRFGLADPAMTKIAAIIHDIDLKEEAFGLPETPGVKALFDGIAASVAGDADRVDRAGAVLDDLLAFFRHRADDTNP